MMAMAAHVADLISAVHTAGGKIRRDGDMIELLAPAPLSADLVARIREAQPALLAALGEPADWHARHRDALAYWSTLHPADVAALLAWGELECRWHRFYGGRTPDRQCAGCGQPIGGVASLDLPDATRVHFDERWACLIRYGERWRGAAKHALIAIGVKPPSGTEIP
jgi:hypothetical protein